MQQTNTFDNNRVFEDPKSRRWALQAWTPAAPPAAGKRRGSRDSSGDESDDASEWLSFLERVRALNATAPASVPGPGVAASSGISSGRRLRQGELLELFAPLPVAAWRGTAAVRARSLLLASTLARFFFSSSFFEQTVPFCVFFFSFSKRLLCSLWLFIVFFSINGSLSLCLPLLALLAQVAPLRTVARVLAARAPNALLAKDLPLAKPPRDVTQRRPTRTPTPSTDLSLRVGQAHVPGALTEVRAGIRLSPTPTPTQRTAARAKRCDHLAWVTFLFLAISLAFVYIL